MTRPSHPSDAGLTARKSADLLRGRGLFCDDVVLDNPAYLHVLRSPVAQSEITGWDDTSARDMPGVLAVHTGADLAGLGRLPVNPVLPMNSHPGFPVLAAGFVHAVGQPVAAVLANSPESAADSAELIAVDYAEVATPEPHRAPPPAAENRWHSGDPGAQFSAAEFVVTADISHPVLAPSPMEPRSVAVRYDPGTNGVTLWQSTQTPHRSRAALATILGIDSSRIRVIAPNVGGAFGMKGSIYPEEVLAVWAALRHQRNIRWTATRSDEFLSATHGRGLLSRGRLAVDARGRFLALQAEIAAPLGYWLPNSALVAAWNAARILPAGYDIDAIDITTTAHLTPRPAMGLYRGAGRPEANMLIEQLVQRAARATGLDPLTIRMANLVPGHRMPHDTATGNRLDSGDYTAMLRNLRDGEDYDAAITRRDTARASGNLAGVGIGFYVEPSGEGWESARVTLTADNRAEIASGSSDQGQSRTAAYTRIAADALGLSRDAITVSFGDTGTCPEGIGALASRSTSIGGSAVLAACRTARKRRDTGEIGAITVETRYETQGQAWGYGLCLADVRIDRDTGAATVDHLTWFDDSGAVVDPALVHGQIIGGAAQGLGEALMEQMVFDEDHQLLSGSFMDYALPRATDMPWIDIHTTQTPSPLNLLGAKGVGEAGTIGAPIAILNAALDAVRPLGINDLTMPLTPFRVWQAINNAEQDTSK